MRNFWLLFICLFILNGCSDPPPPTEEAKATAKTKATTKAEKTDVASTDKKPKGKKPAPKKGTKKPDETIKSDPTTMSTLEEAETAFAAGRYRDAAVIAENSLSELKSDGAPRGEILKRMEYLATCQTKAKSYEKACLTYAALLEAQPDNQAYSKSLVATRQIYWQEALKPKLEEAERLRDRKRLTSAHALGDEVRTAALKVGLDPGPADKVLATITKAQAENPALGKPKELAKSSSPPPKTVPQKKPKKSTKVAPPKKAPVESDSSYPTSGKKR